MKLRNYLGLLAILFLCTACPNDDNGPEAIPFRDRGEQSIADDETIRTYLETHFYNYEEFENPPAGFDYKIVFDTIAGDNSGKIPIIDRLELTSKTYDRFDASNTLYILTAREGSAFNNNGDEAHITTFADSTFVNYTGSNLGGDIFDSSTNPVWFNLPGTIDGFARGIEGQLPGAGFAAQPDGTVVFEDFAIGAIFIPSGLGYFASPPNGNIGIYAPLLFTFDLYTNKITDHDGDGVITINEDVNMNGFLFDDEDNTDGDSVNDFRDSDDDNDGVVTRLEIILTTEMIVNDEGELEEVEVFESFLDTDNDGVSNHLDDDDDGDGRKTIDEIDINFNTGEIIYPDTDNDGTPDYLDADS